MSVPKKKKNMKELNKKATGDLLDAFTEVCMALTDDMKFAPQFHLYQYYSAVLGHSVLSVHLFLFCLLQEQTVEPVSEPPSTQAEPVPVAPAEPIADAVDETWEEKEDKQNAEPDGLDANSEPAEQKYQYKEG